MKWTDDDIWTYIKYNDLPYPREHYSKFKRLGCVGCPMASTKNRIAEYKLYPKIAKAVIKAIERRMNYTKSNSLQKHFANCYEAFYWWLSRKSLAVHKKERQSFFPPKYKEEVTKLINL